MNYKHEQTATILRRRNSIKAYKILDIQGNNLIVRNNLDKSKTDRTAEFPVSEPGNYKVGGYVDMVLVSRGSNSHAIQLIGHTPPEFVPDNGADVVF